MEMNVVKKYMIVTNDGRILGEFDTEKEALELWDNLIEADDCHMDEVLEEK